MTKSEIGQILSKARKDKGVSYYALEKLGLRQNVVKAIERGETSYTIDSLLKLAEVLEVKINVG